MANDERPSHCHTRPLAGCLRGRRRAACLCGPSFDTLANGSVLVTNPAEGLWDANPEEQWQVVEGLRIGTVSGDGPDSFGQVGSIVVDGAGRLWIVDRQATEIRVFDADGEFVRTVGRAGEGPANSSPSARHTWRRTERSGLRTPTSGA